MLQPGGPQITFGDSSGGVESDDETKRRKRGGGSKHNIVVQPTVDARREQSLGYLSQVFVQMFLSNTTRIVSLDDAGRWLLGGPVVRPGQTEAQAQANFKSRVRRLYDIANVFTSLELIEKIHLVQTRKPAFKWTGAGVYHLDSCVPREAYTCDAPAKRSKLASGLPGVPFDPFAMFGTGLPPAMVGMPGLPGLPGLPSVGNGRGGANSPPSVPRRATIDTAELAATAIQVSARHAAGLTPAGTPITPTSASSAAAAAAAAPGSVSQSLVSLQRSFEQFEAAQSRRNAALEEEKKGGGPLKVELTPAPTDAHSKLQAALQPSLARGAMDAMADLQVQLQRQSSSAMKIDFSESGTVAAAAPSRTPSQFARPVSRAPSSLLQLPLHPASAATFDPLLLAYSRVPPASSDRMVRIVTDSESGGSDSASSSAAATASSSRPLAAWDGIRDSSYIRDSRSFLSHYRTVCDVWQKRYRLRFQEMEMHRRMEGGKNRGGATAASTNAQPIAAAY